MSDRDQVKLSVLLRLGARIKGFPAEQWTLRRVREVIEREFGIPCSISKAHVTVHDIGFGSQKSVCRARARGDRRRRVQDAAAEKKKWPSSK